MKKLVSILVLLSTVFVSVSAMNFFTDRFFEFQTSVPISITNNTTTLNSLLKKEIEIDLNEISSKMPKNGFILTQSANPTFGFNLRVLNIFVGVNCGVEMYERFNLSKDFFDLLGKGYKAGDTCEVSLENNMDVFFDMNFDVGFDFRRHMIHVKPTFFIPLATVTGNIGKVTFKNDEEGNILFSTKLNPKLYTVVDYQDMASNIGSMFGGMGFDIGGAVKFPLTEKTEIQLNGRIPIVPGRLTYMEQFDVSIDYKATVQTINDAEIEKNTSSTSSDETYYLNRPLKFGATVDYDVFASIIVLNGGLGFGVSHPFVSDAKFYLEYLLGVNVNLGNILKASLSTEFTDRVYKNQFAVGVNLRVFEIDAGISLQAANFGKSFTGSGLGGFFVVSVGY